MKHLPILIGMMLTVLPSTSVFAQQSSNYPLSAGYLVAFLDTVWSHEQDPIRRRDALSQIHGYESPQVDSATVTVRRNHAVNEAKITALLDKYGWPPKAYIGERGNHTIANVIQHSSNSVKMKYVPLMKQAVKDGQLHPRWLVRTQDRLATSRGELQIYGGQVKYYPELGRIDVWPVYDPANVDKRRAEIGLGPLADHLKRRFDLEWNLEEQIRRTAEFEKQRKKKNQ